MDQANECTFCPGNKATCHLTKIVNGKAVEVHVCEKCIPEISQQELIDFDIWGAVGELAKKKGTPDPGSAVEQEEEISAKSLLIGQKTLHKPTEVCPACGFASADLKKIVRLGCPTCYEVFGPILHDILKDCQKGLRHAGKIPKSMQGLKLKALQEELRKAIAEERFEDAAKIRDTIASTA